MLASTSRRALAASIATAPAGRSASSALMRGSLLRPTASTGGASTFATSSSRASSSSSPLVADASSSSPTAATARANESKTPATHRSLATVASGSRPPTAILMMNMGGPQTLDAVGDFLSRLFHDRELIQLPFQSRLAPLIARRRTPKIQNQYAKIGGGSPILRWTRTQGDEMCKMLDELHPSTAPHKTYVAFRYADPLTEEALDEMARDGVQRAVAFTQYPQYSCSTTGSNINELYREILRRRERGAQEGNIEWSVIDRWPTHPGLVDAFVARIKDTLAKLPESQRSKVPIMFSAHSLPMAVVSGRGDPYPAEVAATVHAVMDKLGWKNPYRVTWQSQVGPAAWLGPQTSDTVKGWAKQGYKDAIAVPIAFTQDHIETLYELDQELVEEAEEHGMKLHRVESLNDHPIFLRAIADIAASHLSALSSSSSASVVGPDAAGSKVWNQGYTSNQMQLRCPGCPNATCGHAKAFFRTGGRSTEGAVVGNAA